MELDWLWADEYQLARLVLHRALGVVYLIAFSAVITQFRALLGERGLLPVPEYVRRTTFRRSPSLFCWRYSDRLALAVGWVGVALSALVVLGVAERLPTWAFLAVWLGLWALYLSVVNVGQSFYSFGWESLLLETGFFAAFLGPAHLAVPLPVLLLLRWALWRLEFGAGLIKLRGDRCWRDLTCLYYHHETQPLPNPLSWYFHHLPKPLHRVEVAANHLAQLVAPFGLLLPQPLAGAAAIVVIVTQSWLLASGNFAWLNALTIVLALGALPDRWLSWLPTEPPTVAAEPPAFALLVLAVTALGVALSVRPLRNLLSRNQVMNASFNRLHLVNTYGAFGSVTRERFEIVIEGTDADRLDGGEVWREYELKGKPGDPARRPRQVAPYHLRLDWLMWFAALSQRYAQPWLPRLARRLLEGDPATLRLLAGNPFPDRPPTHVRALIYRYRFTSPAERRRTGDWWVRTPVGEYLRPVSLPPRADRG